MPSKPPPTLIPDKAGDPGGPFDAASLTPEERDRIIDDLARKVVRRKMETPAILFLEMHKPLTTIASTMVTFSQPTLGAFLGFRRMAEWAALLNERENVEQLIRRIEELSGRPASPAGTVKQQLAHQSVPSSD